MEYPSPIPKVPVRVAAAGEALMDFISRPDGTFDACIGGAVFNLARALSIQGVGTAYLNPFSCDRFGRQMAASLLADGVALGQPEPVHEATSLAVVALGEGGHPDYAFYRASVADRATSAAALNYVCSTLPDLQVICTGALALSPDDAAIYLPWLRAQKVAGRLVVVDANLRPSAMPSLDAYRANVMAALQLADIIKVSDEDLDHLGMPGTDALLRATELLVGTPARALALTLGPDGACLLVRSQDGSVRTWRAREPHAIAVVDTVGAGDSFLAGLLAGLLHRGDHPLAALSALGDARAMHMLGHALASASLCVMQRGCVPPSWELAEARVATLDCTTPPA